MLVKLPYLAVVAQLQSGLLERRPTLWNLEVRGAKEGPEDLEGLEGLT